VKALYLARLAGLKEEKDLEKNIQTDMDGVWLKFPAIKAWVLASTVPSYKGRGGKAKRGGQQR